MWNFNLLAATRTVEAAMPFMLYRLIICLGTAFASLLAALVGAGSFIAFASFSAKPGSVANIGAALGLAAFAFIVYRFKTGLYFTIEAGHLALLAELAQGKKLPQGKAQIELARSKAGAIFASPAAFQDLRDTASRALDTMPTQHCQMLNQMANRQAAAILSRVAGKMTQTDALALLALSFKDGAGNPWQAIRDGLLAHTRLFDLLRKNRLYLLAFKYIGLTAAFLLMLYPVDSAVGLLPVDVGLWRYVFALIFAWSLKAAFLEPIATTAMAGLYFNLPKANASATEMAELASQSEAFKQIMQKAELP
jgi:hypothetical protein